MVTFADMPPKKATAAQKAKSAALGETSRVQRTTRAQAHIAPETLPQTEGSSTPPLVEEIGAAVAADRGAAPPPTPAVPVPEPPAPRPGTEDQSMREAV